MSEGVGARARIRSAGLRSVAREGLPMLGPPRARLVQRSPHEASLDRVRAHHATRSYQRAMRERGAWVEPLFGEASRLSAYRRPSSTG